MVISARHQAVQRAISDLRRGGAVLVRDRDNGAFLIRAAEQINKDTLTDMARLSRSAPYLLISPNRALAIGLHPRDDAAACSIALSV